MKGKEGCLVMLLGTRSAHRRYPGFLWVLLTNKFLVSKMEIGGIHAFFNLEKNALQILLFNYL